MDSGPFQVMFVPVRSKILSTSRAAAAAHQYSMWAIRALKAASTNAESEDGGKTAPKVSAAKKTTATDFATARAQLDAAATQAAAMAIQKQRELRAQQQELAAEEETTSDNSGLLEENGLDNEFDRRIGGIEDGLLANVDSFDAADAITGGVGGVLPLGGGGVLGGGDITADFEGGTLNSADQEDDEADLPPDMDLPPTVLDDEEMDDYSGASDFGSEFNGGTAGG